jgi:sugar phosphate permease
VTPELTTVIVTGVFTILAGVVCWIVYWVKIGGYTKTLGPARMDATEISLASGEEPSAFRESPSVGAQWLVLLVLVFGYAASHLQRIALSLLAPVIQRDLGVSSVQLGLVFGASGLGFMAGYVLMTVVTALCGTRWSLVAAFAGGSLAACASGLFPTITGIIAARFLLGFFTGGLLPAAVQSAREWFPSRLRPLVIGAILAAGPAASALVTPLVVFLSQAMGWRTVLIITGLPTAIAAVLCVVAWPSPPPRETFRGISAAAWASTGMLALGLFFAAPVSYFVMSWLPMYLQAGHNVDLAAARNAITLLPVAGCGGGLLAGVIAWAAAGAGTSSSKVRAAMLTVCGCLLPLVALSAFAQNWAIVIVLAALSAAAYQGWATLLYSAVADTFPARGVAVAAAFGALVLGLSGIASPIAIGQMISSSGYQPVLVMVAASALVALLAVGLLAWRVPQEPAG